MVIGAGWIGTEVAASPASWAADVTLIEPGHRTAAPGARRRDRRRLPRPARRPRRPLRLGTGVAELRGPTATSRPSSPTTAQPSTADVVVIGVGVVPRTELAEAAGLDGRQRRRRRRAAANGRSARRVRRRRRRLRLAPPLPAATCASSTGPTPSTRARPRPDACSGTASRYDAAALLLLRPVRPRHGVRRLRDHLGRVVVRGDLGRPRVHRLLAQRTGGSSPA